MTPTATTAYGLWSLVIINSLVFIIFAFSFAKPKTPRDWRSFGAFSAFLVALFSEMYGYPLTIYFLSGWLSTQFPGVDWLAHDSGHLLEMMFGWKTYPHFGPFHILSTLFIVAGFWLLASAWKVLYAAQRRRVPATTGAYARVRHPQYIGFVLIMTGFLLQWPTLVTPTLVTPTLVTPTLVTPTLVTLAMYPVLVIMYALLGRREEAEMRAQFGDEYRRYANAVPAYVPRLGARDTASRKHPP